MSQNLRVLATLGIRSASLLSSALLVYAIATNLTAKDQGVYYLIQGLMALVFFFDLGIGFLLANLAGRARAAAETAPDRRDWERGRVARFGLAWGIAASICFILVVGAVGLLKVPQVIASSGDWAMWVLLLLGTSANLTLGTVLSLFEGLGFAARVSIIRFAQAFLNASIFLLVTTLNGSPFSIGIAMFLSVSIAAGLFAHWFGREWLGMIRPGLDGPFHWRTKILPFQWRIATSWLTGYFIFQAPTLVLAAWGDLVDAGRFGLSMQIFLAIISVAQVYLTFCVPRWAEIMVNSHGKGAFLEFGKAMVLTLAIILAAGAAVLVATRLPTLERFSDRLLEGGELVRLLIGTCGFQVFMCGNYYFRAQIREALWPVSVLGALMMIVGGVVFRNSISSFVAVDLYFMTGIALATLTVAAVTFDSRSLGRRLAPDQGGVAA